MLPGRGASPATAHGASTALGDQPQHTVPTFQREGRGWGCCPGMDRGGRGHGLHGKPSLVDPPAPRAIHITVKLYLRNALSPADKDLLR